MRSCPTFSGCSDEIVEAAAGSLRSALAGRRVDTCAVPAPDQLLLARRCFRREAPGYAVLPGGHVVRRELWQDPGPALLSPDLRIHGRAGAGGHGADSAVRLCARIRRVSCYAPREDRADPADRPAEIYEYSR